MLALSVAPQFSAKDKKKEPWLSVTVSILGGRGRVRGFLPESSVELLEAAPEEARCCGLCGGGGGGQEDLEMEPMRVEPMSLVPVPCHHP